MSVYRVIDVVGTSTTSWEEAAADAIKTAGQSVRTFGSPRSSSRTFTSGTAANSSTARRSSCPSSTSTNRRTHQTPFLARAQSVVVADTEGNRVGVAAQA